MSLIEDAIDSVDGGVREVSTLDNLKSLLDDARTDIGTALLEHGTGISEETTPTHLSIMAQHRWHRLDRRVKKLKAEGPVRGEIQPWLREVVGVTASALSSGAFFPNAVVGAAIGGLVAEKMMASIARLRKTARPAAEILLDEMRSEKQHPWVPLAP